MNLNHLSDQALLQQTLSLVKKEKEILSEILSHLEEVRKRRLFCELGFGSLFEYCVKYLGYSEDQAYRRINALKLIKELPEVQQQIEKGELTLSSLGVAQSLFKTDSSVDKKAVLSALKNKSKREAEKVIKSFSPTLPLKKKDIHLSLSAIQEEKWNAVKAKLAHCNLREEEILERLCDLFLAPKPKPEPRQPRSGSRAAPYVESGPIATASSALPKVAPQIATKTTQQKHAPRPAPSKSYALLSKAIPATIKLKIFIRDQNCCTNCGSKHALQIDHKLPHSLGGTHHPSNLRILCRACNQRAAIQILGAEKMERYLERKADSDPRA